MYEVPSISFQTFLYWHLKLSQTLESSVCYCYTSYEMTDQFLWFQSKINSYCSNWNTPYLSLLVNFKNAIWTWGHFRKRYAIILCFKLEKMPCDESWIYCYDPETKRQSSQWKHAGSARPNKARQSKSTHKLLMIPFLTALAWSTCTGSHWTDSQQGILCWGFKGVREEILSQEASTLQIGSVAFPPGQCTSPQLHPCHRLFEQDGH